MIAVGSLVNSLGVQTIIRGREANIVHGPQGIVIEPEHPYIDEFREKVNAAGLDGTWIEQKGRKTSILQWLPPSRQEDLIARVLRDPKVEAAWNDAVKRDPELLSNDRKGRVYTKRMDYFSSVISQHERNTGITPIFQVAVPPRREDTMENFIRCIRTREKPALDGRLGFMTQVAVSLGAEAYRRKRVMSFDSIQEAVVEDRAARQWHHRS